MTPRLFPSSRFLASAAVIAASVAALAPSALGAAIPPGVASTPAGQTKADQVTFSWGAAAADLIGTPVSYEYGFVTTDPDPTTVFPTDATSVTLPVPEGTVVFKVRSVEAGVPSLFSEPVSVLVDRTGPVVGSVGFVGTPANLTVNGYRIFKSVAIRPGNCSDAGAGVVCADVPWTAGDGTFEANTRSITVADAIGNVTEASIPTAFKVDTVAPLATAGLPTSPGPAALVAAEPAFSWTHGADANSGVASYELQYKRAVDDTFTTLATVPDTGGVGDYTARRGANDPALPQQELLEWRVRTIDNAGNVRNSVARRVTIDPTIPASPVITGGPSTPTSDASPTMSWTGTQQTFIWDLTIAGRETPVRQGGGNATQTTLASLPDGDYTFRVAQVTGAGVRSAEATRSFKIDTTPPAAPVITVRPTFPAIGATPTFGWSTEPGAYSRWSVLDGAGTSVYGPIDTPVTSTELPPLAEGPYVFQVLQIDPAGNVSPSVSEAFTVIGSLAPAPAPSLNPRSAFLAALPKQNARRLQPSAGTILPTLRPVLRWKKGPRGTRLYNLQIFKVTARKGNAKPKVTKVLSRFPRGLQFRTPEKNLVAGTCYVWRVWPYTGTAFTTRPVGVSNFCVAGKKVLRAKALKAAANRLDARRKRAAGS